MHIPITHLPTQKIPSFVNLCNVASHEIISNDQTPLNIYLYIYIYKYFDAVGILMTKLLM